jgi:Mg-chelatase subunit ChlD
MITRKEEIMTDSIIKLEKRNVDVVFCIDGSGSMFSHIDAVKNYVRRFHEIVGLDSENYTKRVKIIVFYDYFDEHKEDMESSRFLVLPDERVALNQILDSIIIGGGGDDNENGLEALYFAMKSEFKTGDKDLQIIVLFSDADAHALDSNKQSPNYPNEMANKNGLIDLWNNSQFTNKHLVLVAPEKTLYAELHTKLQNSSFVAVGTSGFEDVNLKSALKKVRM